MTNEQSRRLLNHQTLKRRHPQQYVFFTDPDKVYLDFTRPIACSLLKHQQVSHQRELVFNP